MDPEIWAPLMIREMADCRKAKIEQIRRIMEEKIVYDRKPQVLTLAKGDYWWCSCGRSQTQPYCDGSHKGTGLAPMKFTLAEEKTVAICNCKHSANPPFCDGFHSKLPPA